MNKRKDETRKAVRLVALTMLVFAFVSAFAFPGTATNRSSVGPLLGINVANNSSREIRHLYLSPADQNNWGPDLLGGSVIRNGETFTINDAACTGNEIKVIAEDQQGCFLYSVVSCAQATTSWTITNDTAADCG